ncbi:cell adhesion molecule CEACAM5-like, partial [Chaetodon auriga]|uniref:cell adhesion molecule CEACAM5-like n=1 Tax=Chaetodon auriga TaxID=39042 RepID=UPI004032E443
LSPPGLTKGAAVLPDGPLNAAVGGTVMFTTTLAPPEKPFFSVAWAFGDRNIITSNVRNITGAEYEDRITYFPSTGSLQLRNLSLDDSGEYRVSITPSGEAQTNGNIRLDVYVRVAGVMVTSDSTDLVEFNSTARLSCSSSGPSLSFLWLNGSSEVTQSDRVKLTDGNSTLTVVNVSRYDQGPFRCRVFNPVSNGSSGPVNLSISYGPENIKLTKSPSQEYFEEGSNISLMCSAVSRPAALFYWFLNGDQLPDTGSELRLTNIQMNHSGNYSCQAFSQKTLRRETSQPSVVFVLERVSGASVSPSVNLLIEGNSTILSCEAAGSFLNRTWMKDGSDLIPTDNITLQDNNRVLSFQPLKRTDSGQYSCNIINPVSSEAAHYTMVVNYGPENLQITGQSEINVGQTLTLTCSAESTPSAQFTWTLNGAEIHNSSVFTKDNAELSDSGNYTCQAMNNVTGRAPSAVHGLSVTAIPNRTPSCSTGCIVGIVIACLVVCAAAAAGGGYCIYIRKKRTKNTGAEGQNNTAFSGSQELNYADFRISQRNNGGTVQMEPQDNSTEYAQVRVNNGPPAPSSPPTYDAHMERMRSAAEPEANDAQNYAQVRKVLDYKDQDMRASAAASLMPFIEFIPSRTLDMSVLASGAVEVQPSINPAVVGDTVTLSLSPSATLKSGSWAVGKTLILTWLDDQQAVFPSHSGRASVNFVTGALTLSSVKVADSGVYIVQSTQLKANASISVLGKNKWLMFKVESN